MSGSGAQGEDLASMIGLLDARRPMRFGRQGLSASAVSCLTARFGTWSALVGSDLGQASRFSNRTVSKRNRRWCLAVDG